MSTGTQVDPPSLENSFGGLGVTSAGGASGAGAGTAGYLSDEEILGIDPPSPNGGFGGPIRRGDGDVHGSRHGEGERGANLAGESGKNRRQDADATKDATYDSSRDSATGSTAVMPEWMAALAGDPRHGAEAQQLWQEHQAFRATFSSPDEARAIKDDARAIKELFPGGMQEARTLKQGTESLREAAQSVDRIDAAIFSGDVRAQSEVVAEIARANPAAFRSLVAEATKVLAGMEAGGRKHEAGTRTNIPQDGAAQNAVIPSGARNLSSIDSANRAGVQRDSSVAPASQALSRNDNDRGDAAPVGPAFDPAAYASFERTTNDVVARDVRGSISETLSHVLPEGVAEGAARRIGEDIFNEVHRALAADRTLSEQVGEVLRDRRFGNAEQQHVAALLAGRAKQLVPSVARRVIGEWTSSVLTTARTKAARHAAAASRVDIAAPGGSLDSMPLRAMSPREVNYASMSDDEILNS